MATSKKQTSTSKPESSKKSNTKTKSKTSIKTSTKKTTTPKKPSAKETITTVVNKENAKKAAKATTEKASSSWVAIRDFFVNLNKAYYVGALAVLSIILFFSAWIDVPMISNLGKLLNVSAISGLIAIPQALLSLCGTVDSQALNISNLLNYLDVSNINVDQVNQIYQTIKSVAAMLGLNVSDWTFNVNDFIVSLQQIFPDPDQIYALKHLLAQISGYAKVGIFAVVFVCLMVVGFNVYTAVIAFWKKKVTKLCKVGFIIELILCALVIVGCNVINGAINSQIFFINNVFVPTFWAWLTLIVCIVSIIVVSKITKKAGEKLNVKRLVIVLIIIAAVIAIICIIVTIDQNNKKKPFIGNWNISTIEKDNYFDQDQLKKLEDKGVDFNKSIVISIKDNNTYEESLFGHLIKGTYQVVPEGILLNPDYRMNSDFARIVLKQTNGNLTANLGCFELAKLSTYDSDAKTTSDEIKYAVGIAAIDYALDFAGIKDMSAEDIVKTLNKIYEQLKNLSELDQYQIVHELKELIGEEVKTAYNKLDSNQKKAVDGIYYMIVNAK